jgi:class 3 adenylate cyclase
LKVPPVCNGEMERLPAGTVTMLFSDIEGSTMLLTKLGNRYVDALAAHRAILRSAWSSWFGREVGTEGDSFFVVFDRAGNAIGAALQAQRELAAQAWPSGARVRVRMGVHTGEPMIHDDTYVGMDVHRAARIANAAHGARSWCPTHPKHWLPVACPTMRA